MQQTAKGGNQAINDKLVRMEFPAISRNACPRSFVAVWPQKVQPKEFSKAFHRSLQGIPQPILSPSIFVSAATSYYATVTSVLT
jgi:hypothetical protein